MPRIALDAMGGDRAPAEIVAGALEAMEEGVDLVLVGDREALRAHLGDNPTDVAIVDARQVIDMSDEPARALRKKPESSVAVAARLVRDGEAAGFVSAGSTGAAMAAAALIIGRVPGVLRPSIASIWPTPPTPTVVLDSGANPEVKPAHLVQFGLMGSVAAEVFLGLERPRVGLLSNGEERGKGRDLERKAYASLEATSLHFVGNIEGRDVGAGRADVIVTDGFTGNVFLKAVEGTVRMVSVLALEAISHLDGSAQAAALPALEEVWARLDWENHGGAHLLGARGVVVIAHGSSTRVSIANALRLASEGAAADLVGRVAARVAGT